MLSPRWRKMLRDAWLHKPRSLLVVLAVSVGMIASGALLDAWALVRRVTAETYHASHPVSATLRVDAIDEATLAQVRALPSVAALRMRRTVYAKVVANGADLTAELFALQDFAVPQIGRLESERGTWPPRDGEISIEKSSLEFSGTSLGAALNLRVGKNPPQMLHVSGIAHDVSLPPGWMDHVVYGFVTPATLAQLGAPASPNEIQIVVRDGGADRDAVRRIASGIKALVERNGVHVTNIDVPVPGQHAHAAQMNSLMATQGAFAVLTLLVCSFLIVNLITAMLAGQTREIGVMKSLGARATQIAAMYLGFALILGLLASVIALPVAVAIGRPYAGLKADMLNFSIEGFAIPWWTIAIQLVVGCLLPVVAAAAPVARACRVPVSTALRDAGIVADTGAYLRSRMTIRGISRPLLLSIGNAFRRRQRMLLTLLTLAMGGAVFLGADDLRRSVRESVDQLFSGERYDIVLSLSDAYPAAQSEAVAAKVAGVEHVQALASTTASIEHAGGLLGNRFTVVALPPQSPMFVRNVAAGGRWLNPSDTNALVITQALQKDEPALVPGAEATLVVDGEATRWRIVGVDRGIQPLAYAPMSAFGALHVNDGASTLVVATRDRDVAGQLDAIARLRVELERAGMPVAGSRLMSESRRAIEDHLLMVVQFLGAMAWVMIVVGGMGLASTMGLAVLERTREVGVMRAIGARPAAIIAMIEIEGVFIAVLGWVVSLPLSTPMSAVLADAFGRVMFSVPTHYVPSLAAASVWLLLAVVIATLACAWPAWRATRMPTAAALSHV